MAFENTGDTHETWTQYSTLGLNLLNNNSYTWPSSENINGSFLNKSVQQILLENWGPKQRGLTSVIILLIIYCLIFISGTVGNICTCIVIARNSYMQTTTNYYLFSLAISDVLILIFGLPQEAYTIWEAYPWRFGEAFCIFKALLNEMTSYASVLTITAFTMERYIAICHPLISHKIANLSRAVKIIIFIWIISFLCALPYPIHTDVFYFLEDSMGRPIPDSLSCNIPSKWHVRMTYMFQLSTFLFFIMPMTLISVLYILIAITLRKAALSRAASEDSTQGHGNHIPTLSRRAVLRMLVAVVVAFFVCWAPFHAQRLLTLYNSDWTATLLELQSHLFFISGVLYFVGSTVNPILYNLMSKRYREAFKETICCCFWKRISTFYGGKGSYYYSSRSPRKFTSFDANSRKFVAETEHSFTYDDTNRQSVSTNNKPGDSLRIHLLKKRSDNSNGNKSCLVRENCYKNKKKLCRTCTGHMNGQATKPRTTKVCFSDSPRTEMIELEFPPTVRGQRPNESAMLIEEHTTPTIV